MSIGKNLSILFYIQLTKLMIMYIISLEMSKGDNMERMSIKEFKTKSNIEIIEELMKANNGYVTSKLIS